MLENYLITFFRILLRERIYSVINVTGLAIGLAASLLIALYIADELSYDRFHRDADRIFRVGIYVNFSNNESRHASSGTPVCEALQRDFPEIESTLRLRPWTNTRVSRNDDVINLRQVIVADSNFFNFFSFELLEGNPSTVLVGKNKIVLTSSMAKALFGYDGPEGQSPVGQLVQVGDEKITMEVTGIAADSPANAHFHFNALVSFATIEPNREWFMGTISYNYFKVRSNGDEGKVQSKFLTFSYKYLEPEVVKITGKSLQYVLSTGEDIYFFFQPLVDIHLKSNYLSEIESNGDESVLYLMGGISGCIVLLACINFVNLITARGLNRAKEVGVRKTMGAVRQRLIKQFLLESFLYTVLAISLALTIVSLVLVPFNVMVDKSLSLNQLYRPEFISGIIGLVVIVTLLSGIYPALYVTSYSPAQVLKGYVTSEARGLKLRSILVTFQFVISIVMLIGTISVYRQIGFLLNRNPGFKKDNVICLEGTRNLGINAEAFKNELKQTTAIIDASFCSNLPSDILESGGYRRRNSDHWHTMLSYSSDEDHEKVMGLSLLKGRYFSKDVASDSGTVVLNETAARLAFIDDLSEKTPFSDSGNKIYDVIGIVKDFNFESAKGPVKPLVIYYGKHDTDKMMIRVSAGSLKDNLEKIAALWKRYTDTPLEYSFLDRNFNQQYESEQRLMNISGVLTILAVLIACLGLFGLITYIAGQRKREIGIRKVLGASTPQVVVLLSKHFAGLLAASFCVALPLSWYAVNQWLNSFAFRIDYSVLVAVCCGGSILVMALITVSYQAVRAGLSNPVENLRSE